MSRIYKILPRADWIAAQQAGQFDGSPLDQQDGFIHFSTAAQVRETARRHFSGQVGLVVLEVETDDLGDGVRWEPSRGGALFPHLYGPLPLRQVRGVTEAPLDADGAPAITVGS
ncbi:DUF952 domain-containing protein [Phenylobacterium sp.]|uniref:DUF952 domain-containing protein n=1 Tax=Phenylobacterium sp. TaxID=1871053 RepID=UPI00286CF650|nr:DUF952 domain-containing protein [Phenylobacterium sp.]